MAAQRKRKPRKKSTRRRRKKPAPLMLRARRWVARGLLAVPVLLFLWVAVLAVVNPPVTPYMAAEALRLGGIKSEWTNLEDMAASMPRAVVAAEDANFCLHWGFDIAALRVAIEDGGQRGASTLTQQVVKNVFLWHGRSYPRKALEALITPLVEAIWTKRRILEVYLNVAEFDAGVFGVKAAAQHYFGATPDRLTGQQAARLAALLPKPKERSAANPGAFVRARAQAIAEGAATIAADGRAECFAD